MTGRTRIWIGGMMAGLGPTALIAYLIAVGLDEADKVASVVGLFVALAGLAISASGLRHQDRRGSGSGQAVSESTVGGGVVQITDATGNVRITHHPTPTPTQAVPPPSRPDPAPAADLAQTVRGSAVSGPVDQLKGIGGDTEIEQ